MGTNRAHTKMRKASGIIRQQKDPHLKAARAVHNLVYLRFDRGLSTASEALATAIGRASNATEKGEAREDYFDHIAGLHVTMELSLAQYWGDVSSHVMQAVLSAVASTSTEADGEDCGPEWTDLSYSLLGTLRRLEQMSPRGFLPLLPEVLGLPRAEACEDQEVGELITAAFGGGWEINDAKQLGWGVEGWEPDETSFCELYCRQAAKLDSSLLCSDGQWPDMLADQAHAVFAAWYANQVSACYHSCCACALGPCSKG
jgi:hypothetical protein